MLNLLRFVLLVFISTTGLSVTFGQVIPTIPGRDLMPLSSVKEGMKGTARTVFRGSGTEEFGVEILGVVPGAIGPGQDLLIGILSGANAERTQVFAGMSGSPVYIDGKLVGAISYSFPFAKEAICGITPIEQMVAIFSRSNEPARVGTMASYSVATLMSTNWRAIASPPDRAVDPTVLSSKPNSRLSAVSGQVLAPIATPLAFGGVSQATLDAFIPDLARSGILAIATLGGTGKPEFKQPDAKTLLGGDSVVVQLARGDLSIAAAGTVTWRDGDKIYAFGHPYFGLGSADLPMNESHVITVVPNINNSFKLAVTDATVGSMIQDRSTGIYGQLGRSPRMVPVTAHIRTSRGRDETINFDSAIDDFLTPLIVNVGLLNSIQSNERQLGDTTVSVSGEITIKGQNSVRIDRRYSGVSASAMAAASPAVPLAALLRSNFAGLEVAGVKVDLTVNEGSSTASLERLSIDKARVRAGETVELTLSLRTDGGVLTTRTFPVTIPADAAPGTLGITVADGSTVQENSSVKQYSPRNAAELIGVLNTLRRSDRLYAVLTRNSAGVIVGSSELPNLPPSLLATLNNERTSGGSKPLATRTLSEQVFSIDEFIVSGSQVVSVEIVP